MKYDETKLQEIYEHICQNPGVDTPAVCVYLYEAGPLENTNAGPDLAAWLSEWYPEAWTSACAHVDHLIQLGDIVFTDSGRLYATGYQGAIL